MEHLELYKIFLAVAKAGGVLKASEQLYISQPAVSKSIQQLENKLDCKLFIRTKKGVTLTAEGEELYGYVDKAFNFLSAGEQKVYEMKQLLCGNLSIGVSDTICRHYLLPLLKAFYAKFPGIKINVVCPTTPEIIGQLKAGAIDFGIINMPVEDGKLEFKTIMQVQDCFVCGQKYKHLSGKYLPLSKIAEYPMVLLERSSNSRLFIDRYIKQNNIEVKAAFELGNMDMLIHFARNDMGVACVIRNFIEDEIEKGILFEVKPSEKIPPRSIAAVWLKDTRLSYAAKELISFIEYEETYEF